MVLAAFKGYCVRLKDTDIVLKDGFATAWAAYKWMDTQDIEDGDLSNFVVEFEEI